MSYIGKNPKVDSVKLEGAATAASGTDEGQLYYNTGTGSISKGLKVFKNGQFVSIDKQLGDADTFHLLKAADISTAEFSAARNSTSTSFLNQNAVPFETTTASGAAGTFSNSSTGDALLTDESADLVFAYKSSGTSDDAQEYFGIPLSVPKAFRGGNVVLTFEYRTGFGTGTTATVDGDFEVAVLDKSTGNGAQTTTTDTSGTAIAAGSNIAVASKTGLVVGQRIRLETGSSTIAAGSPDATVTEAFITSISTSTDHITISESYAPPSTSGGRITSGWLTDVVPGQIPAADSQTNKQGKKFSIQFKTEDDTSDIVLFFQNKNTSSTISRHLFVDNILLSANKFLQAGSKLKSENYYAKQQTSFWDFTGTCYVWDKTMLTAQVNTPALDDSKYITVSNIAPASIPAAPSTGTNIVTAITAKQNITLSVTIDQYMGNSAQLSIFNSSDERLMETRGPNSAAAGFMSLSTTINLAKDDYVYFQTVNLATTDGAIIIHAESETSDVILLESQDEIFTDYTAYTPTITGGNTTDVDFYFRRIGDEIDIKGTMILSTRSSTEPITFSLPSGHTMDTSQLVSKRSVIGRGQWLDQTYYVTDNVRQFVLTYDSTQTNADTKLVVTTRVLSTASEWNIENTSAMWGDDNRAIALNARVKVKGFNSNFNPLLSLPLVDTGNKSESFLGYDVSGASTKSYRGILDNITVNTISTLGTIDNSSTNGWSFQANQRVKCYFAFGMANGPGVAGICGVKFSDDPSTVSDNPLTSSHFDGLRVTGVQDSDGAGYQATASGNFIMEAGEFLQFGQEGTSFQNSNKAVVSLIVEKAEDRTQLAHIIKPAICEFSMQLASNTSGGDSTGGAWNQLKPNTFKGETWFLSGFNGTLGVGGTNTDFDLDPGTYSLECTTQVYSAGTAMLKLISGTTVFAYGQTQYTNSTTGDAANASLFTTFTITSKTTFTIKMQTSASQSPNGLGHAAGISGVPETYLAGFIHKLK